ncbi:5'-3' exoribonuclease 2 homolog [Musca vetustissima]|uniref:5'-3' exoribonuclease 2 homolog n=1 Tax=Musca vetustissima TaxID=27455 RepID=UPI002AB79BD3|nr:5'-3' exoribonuclease 2 homolog [Musca vetustissima]
MGVPAFFRWLSRKYPSVIIECVENKEVDPESGKNIYPDATQPNPNGIEFDNLYLDMNGIIHPCTHPEDKPAPKNEDEMMVAIFDCIDRLMNIVRPRKVLYMAIDGVAPRAKMNQQRSRRFRAAKESVEKRLEMERIRSELLAKGCVLPPEKEKGEHFDSNCITPGTPFMERLSQCLHYYVHDRLNNNPAWKDIKVILSDANVPGEGEHKIMDYIRKQRAQPDHDPNTQHVLCGADADLIMLGLATHEPNFTIIREEFLPNKPKPCDMCGQFGHEMDKCQGLNAAGVNDVTNFKPDVPIGSEVRFIFVRLSVLREYLKKTLEMPNLPFKYEFERALDDWVFMCFFVGNDFLPHLPSLEIREGAVDRLVELYKKCVYRTNGYLTNSGEVDLDRVQLILTDLGNVEDHIFKERQRREVQFKQREKIKRRNEANAYNAAVMEQSGSFKLNALGKGNANPLPIIDNYKQNAANLRNAAGGAGQKRTAAQAGLDEDEEDEYVNDEVRLWENGFKDRYYESKFDVGQENLDFRYSVALQYVRGLCWVLKYYYQGCASWDWYFPYHYAPFASDFVNISGLSTHFAKGSKPFNPLEQLMGVFPAASSSHVPKPWATLMHDPQSDIIDFYPEDFKIDLNGKKYAWQGVALLPFVDENRLFKALKPYYGMLTEEEIKRNKRGDCRLYISQGNSFFKTFVNYYAKNKFATTPEIEVLMDGMFGTVLEADDNVPINGTLPSPIMGLHDITENQVVTVRFRDPQYDEDFIFPAKRLQNAIDPPTVLAPEGRDSNYKPRIGFNHDMPQAYVSQAGHRHLNNAMGQGNYQNQYNTQGFNYNNMNNNYNNNRNSSYGRGGGGGGGGGGGRGGPVYGGAGRGGGAGGVQRFHPYGQGGRHQQQQQPHQQQGRFQPNQQQQQGGGYASSSYQNRNYQQQPNRRPNNNNNNNFPQNNLYNKNSGGNNWTRGGGGGGGGGRRYN